MHIGWQHGNPKMKCYHQANKKIIIVYSTVLTFFSHRFLKLLPLGFLAIFGVAMTMQQSLPLYYYCSCQPMTSDCQ